MGGQQIANSKWRFMKSRSGARDPYSNLSSSGYHTFTDGQLRFAARRLRFIVLIVIPRCRSGLRKSANCHLLIAICSMLSRAALASAWLRLRGNGLDLDRLRGNAGRDGERRNVLGGHTEGAHQAVFMHAHSTHHPAAPTHPPPPPDLRPPITPNHPPLQALLPPPSLPPPPHPPPPPDPPSPPPPPP